MTCVIGWSAFSANSEMILSWGEILIHSSIFEKGLSRLEKWTDSHNMKFKGICQGLHLGRNKSVQQCKLGAIWIESSPAENDVENLVNIKLNAIKQCVLA